MANRWLFAGADLGNVRVESGTLTSTTSGSVINTAYADHSLGCSSNNIGICDFVDSAGASDAAVTGEKLWVRFAAYPSSVSTVASFVELVDGSDQPWLALRSTGTAGVCGLYYNSGTGESPVWTQVGADAAAVPSSNHQYIDIWITLGSPHSAGFLVDNVHITEGSFTQASLTSLDALRLRNNSANTAHYSEVMATVGINTVNGHVATLKPSAAGSNAGWTGAYTAVDEVGLDDTDAISSGTAAQRSTFTYGNLPALGTGRVLGDVFMYTRARNDGAAPSQIKPVRRDSGGTDNVGTAFSGVTTGYSEHLTRYAGLSESEINASEFGVESDT